MNLTNLLLTLGDVITSIFLLITGKTLLEVKKHQDYPSFAAPLRTFNVTTCEFAEREYCLLQNVAKPSEIVRLNYETNSTWYELNGTRHEVENEVEIAASKDENVCKQLKDLASKEDSGGWIKVIEFNVCVLKFCRQKQRAGVESFHECLQKQGSQPTTEESEEEKDYE